MYFYSCLNVSTHSMYMCAYICTHAHMYIFVSKYVCMCVCVCVCLCVCVYGNG